MRILRIELEAFGQFRDLVMDLGAEPHLVALTGPNYCGKSTLIEAVGAVLYGWGRGDENRLRREAYEPRVGQTFAAAVLMETRGETVWLRRDFHDNRVQIRAGGSTGDLLWAGDANPAGANAEVYAYRDRLKQWLGIEDGELAHETFIARQGSLLASRLDEEVESLLAGGGASPTEVKAEILKRYNKDVQTSLTQEPLDPTQRRQSKPRRIERLQQSIEETRNQLAAARSAQGARLALDEELRSLAEKEGHLRAIREAAESLRTAAQELLEARNALDVAGESTQGAEERRKKLDAHIRRINVASGREGALSQFRGYPADFDDRVKALEAETRRAAELRESAAPAAQAQPGLGSLLVGGALLALAGAVILVADVSVLVGGAVLAVGIAMALWGYQRRTATLLELERTRGDALRAQQALEECEAGLAVLREELSVIASSDLGVDGLKQQVLQWSEWRRADSELRTRIDETRLLLDGDSPAPSSVDEAIEALDRARRKEARRGSTSQQRVAEAETAASSALERIGRVEDDRAAWPPQRLTLWDELGVVDDAQSKAGVEALRVGERQAASALRECQDQQVDQRNLIAELPSVSSTPDALESDLAELESMLVELRATRDALRVAWEALQEAVEEFQSGSMARAGKCASEHLAAMTGGRLVEVRFREVQDFGIIDSHGREEEPTSPPLSYAELRQAHLALRLGLGQFLGGDAVIPLILDEPFASFDVENRNRALAQLSAFARSEGRQVIVTTPFRVEPSDAVAVKSLQAPPGDHAQA